MTALAQELFDAFETGSVIAPPTAGSAGLSVEDAYATQRALLALHGRAGRAVVGRKIGLTSEAIQRQLGIDSPDYGAVLDSHVYASGDVLSRSERRMIAPRIEAELAFVLDRDLAGPGLDRAAVLGATASVVPVFEVIDSRIADWRIGLADTIADNASCFGVVVGAPMALHGIGDLADVTVQITRDDVPLQTGQGSAVLGHPAAAVAWLGNALAGFGELLPAGQLILSGSFTAAVDALPGTYVATFGDPVGTVTVGVVA